MRNDCRKGLKEAINEKRLQGWGLQEEDCEKGCRDRIAGKGIQEEGGCGDEEV